MHRRQHARVFDDGFKHLCADDLVDVRNQDKIVATGGLEPAGQRIALVNFTPQIVRFQDAVRRKVVHDDVDDAVEERRKAAAVLRKIKRLRMAGVGPGRLYQDKSMNRRRVLMKPDFQ